MKKILRSFVFCLFLFVTNYANGVAVKDAANNLFLTLQQSQVDVTVQGQISVTKVTNVFKNPFDSCLVKYAFPLGEQASAVNLRYNVDGVWYIANMVGQPQDTTLPGGGGGGGSTTSNLTTYLGSTPLYFAIPNYIHKDSLLIVELSYVELLPYKFGKVSYNFPNDYHLVQTQSLLSQQFSFYLSSQRKIDSIFVQCSYPISQVSNTGNSAYVSISTEQQEANSNYLITYVLDASQLGLFSYSTFQPQGSLPDSLGRGFFSFIAEPDPSVSTSTISKVFTLIVDRSGSMSYESKMDQAKQAATYIVQNLNEGDKFNVIDFDDIITCFQPNHVAYSPETKAAAIAYIQNLYARGNTSISGAFGTAVPQFTSANDSTANIIMFLTDGQPTADIINTDALVNYVTQLITNSGRKIYTYCFGIGSDVNTQLLTLLASNNNGFATILSNNELYATVTDFYNSIRNPVLLSPKLSFSPAVVSQVYPDSLSNLYKGNQLIAAGRYSEAVKVQATFSGKAFNKDVTYQYMLDLSDSLVVENQFMTKLWAKKKIESLLIKYYRLDANSSEAAAIKDQITKLSIAYRVITPFTSFSGGYIGTGIETKHGANKNLAPTEFELLGNYPNPFNPNTIIRIRVNSEVNTVFEIRIYSITGELVKIIPLPVHGKGDYRVSWDGTNMFGKQVASGIYIYSVTGMNQIMTKKMMLLR